MLDLGFKQDELVKQLDDFLKEFLMNNAFTLVELQQVSKSYGGAVTEQC